MAIAPTGAIYKALSFDNTSSRNYGVYITGEAVYNAPEREVEMITIPGRNGSFALDHGRFENITVSYPAGIFADTEADFVQAISDFRNFLCSKKGYCRLTDEYNPNEYRMAVYKSGLEVDPVQLKAGQFNIVFDCKPQRFLTSGETKTTIAQSGNTISNPTLFEAAPLLEIEGYGTIDVNGTEIEIADELVGDVSIFSTSSTSLPLDISFPETYIAPSDSIEIDTASVTISLKHKGGDTFYTSGSYVDSYSGYSDGSPTIQSGGTGTGQVRIKFTNPATFSYGTFVAYSVQCSVVLKFGTHTYTVPLSVGIRYDGDKTLSLVKYSTSIPNTLVISSAFGDIHGGTIHSTATTFGHPTYIDCEIGEAYAVNSGVVSSLNQYIALGSQLPKLDPGANTITYDNTINSFKITPRWWKV